MTDETLSKGDQTRTRLIDAAHHLFLQQGYHGTSMRQIADAAGIALGAIYNHFPGKETLFKTVFLENHPYQEMLPAVQSAQGNDVESLVRDMAYRMVDSLNNRPDFLNLMFIEIVEFNSLHVAEMYESIIPQVTEHLERLLPPDRSNMRPIHPIILARAFIGWFFAYYLTGLILRPVHKLPQALQQELEKNGIDQFIELFLHGIMKEKE